MHGMEYIIFDVAFRDLAIFEKYHLTVYVMICIKVCVCVNVCVPAYTHLLVYDSVCAFTCLYVLVCVLCVYV